MTKVDKDTTVLELIRFGYVKETSSDIEYTIEN